MSNFLSQLRLLELEATNWLITTFRRAIHNMLLGNIVTLIVLLASLDFVVHTCTSCPVALTTHFSSIEYILLSETLLSKNFWSHVLEVNNCVNSKLLIVYNNSVSACKSVCLSCNLQLSLFLNGNLKSAHLISEVLALTAHTFILYIEEGLWLCWYICGANRELVGLLEWLINTN